MRSSERHPFRVLILGGTTEASALARLLAAEPGVVATLSLAGRTKSPAPQPIPVRIGGFGGPAGLASFLRDTQTDLLIDATHPFAAQMSRNAAEAARAADIPLLAILRPAWLPGPGDQWHEVDTVPDAVVALGQAPRRVLLTVGGADLAPFLAAPQHRYVIRAIDPPAIVPQGATLLTARGPFQEAEERTLLQEHAIERIVAKNSGGDATSAKLAAARALGVSVIMVRRPEPPAAVTRVADADAAHRWLRDHIARRGE